MPNLYQFSSKQKSQKVIARYMSTSYSPICRSYSVGGRPFLSHVRKIADLGFKLNGDQVTVLSLQVTFFKGQKCAGYLSPPLTLPGVRGRLFLTSKLIWDGFRSEKQGWRLEPLWQRLRRLEYWFSCSLSRKICRTSDCWLLKSCFGHCLWLLLK